MSIQILLSLIILGFTEFRELNAAVWRDTGKEWEEQSKESVTPPIVRQPDFSVQQHAILNTLRNSGLLRLTDALQAGEPAADLLITSSDLDQLNSLLLEHPDLLDNGILEIAPTLAMDSTQTSSSSFSVNITKLRSLIQQQPNLLNTLIEALNKANEKQSNEVHEHQRVRRNVNASQDVVSDHDGHLNQSSTHQQLENEKQYKPTELVQQNVTAATRVQSYSDDQDRDEESQSSFEEVVELEILTNDTSPVPMETILDQLDEIRDMCIEILEGSTSPEVTLIDELNQVREICRAFLQEFTNNIMVPIEAEIRDEKLRLM